MFTLENVLSFAKEFSNLADMIVRMCIELATHALSILSAM